MSKRKMVKRMVKSVFMNRGYYFIFLINNKKSEKSTHLRFTCVTIQMIHSLRLGTSIRKKNDKNFQVIYYNLKYRIKVWFTEARHIYERISGSISIHVCQSENLLRRNEQKIINRLSHILYT